MSTEAELMRELFDIRLRLKDALSEAGEKISALRTENAALRKEIAELRSDASDLCEIIEHADPAAWRNGNTPPDHAYGPDEGEVLMSEMYSPLRAKYFRVSTDLNTL